MVDFRRVDVGLVWGFVLVIVVLELVSLLWFTDLWFWVVVC